LGSASPRSGLQHAEAYPGTRVPGYPYPGTRYPYRTRVKSGPSSLIRISCGHDNYPGKDFLPWYYSRNSYRVCIPGNPYPYPDMHTGTPGYPDTRVPVCINMHTRTRVPGYPGTRYRVRVPGYPGMHTGTGTRTRVQQYPDTVTSDDDERPGLRRAGYASMRVKCNGTVVIN